MEKKVPVSDLAPGVYVSRLDRPWTETPFMFQGFVIQSQDEIDQLWRYCEHVYIDIVKGDDCTPADSDEVIKVRENRIKNLITQPAPISRYKEVVPVDEEIKVAKDIHKRASEEVASILDGVEEGKNINISGAKAVIGDIVSSIIRNPDAFSWLAKLKSKDSYTYSHCLDVCALTLAFGRHLGLPKADLEVLGLAALFFDVGKLKFPPELLDKSEPLSPAEAKFVRTHVRHSVEILKQTPGVSKEAIDAVSSHHERYDGSGYPRGLSGEQIPVMGRMIAITDVYDAITSNRPYGEALSPAEAVGQLYESRNKHFQEALVEQFIQCVGAFPVGSLVELSTGQIAVVLSKNPAFSLKPKVLLIMDAEQQRYEISPIIDLLKETQDEQGRPLAIKKALDPSKYDIDLNELYL